MNHSFAAALVLVLGSFTGPPASGAEKSAPPDPPPAKKQADAPPSKKAPARPQPAPGSVESLAREFGEGSKDLISRRKALLERLRHAQSEEEKQRIVAELRQQQQQRLEQQREIARQIREQMQNKRSDPRPAGPGG